MHLREDEKILRVYRHHAFPFAVDVVKIVLGSLPFYFLLYLFSSGLSSGAYALSAAVITFFFLLILANHAFIYWMDRLIITTRRAIYIDWKFITLRQEIETELDEVQDVRTHEKGIFSAIPFLNYGSFQLETAASQRTIVFEKVTDPEGIRDFVYSIKKGIVPV